MTAPTLELNPTFTELASDEQIERTAAALNANGIRTLIAENAEDAKRLFFELLPEGAEVFLGASATLETLGIQVEVDKSGRYDALRPKMFAMNRQTQGNEIRKMIASPTYAAGSPQAITEDGRLIFASATGSQLGPYVSGAGIVIWVAGAQKIVKDVAEGLRRIDEHVTPLETIRTQKAYGIQTSVNKLLIVNKEARPGRATMIIVKEVLGY